MHASAATRRALTPAGIRCAQLAGISWAYKMARVRYFRDSRLEPLYVAEFQFRYNNRTKCGHLWRGDRWMLDQIPQLLDRIPKAVWFAIGLGFLIGFSGLVGWSSAQPPHHQTIKSAAQTPENKTIQDVAAETIAYYTEILAWFTGILALVSAFQGYMLLLADKTPRKSADAAKSAAENARRSVDAFVDAERPRVFISKITPAIRDCPGPKFEGTGVPFQIMLKVTIKNYGRTPATQVAVLSILNRNITRLKLKWHGGGAARCGKTCVQTFREQD